MPDLVLVDFDDTLVETAPAFHQAREALFSRLEAEGFPRDTAFHVHHEEVEPELLKTLGMGPFRMEPSFRATYVRLCEGKGRPPDPSVEEECGGLGRDFMGRPKVMDGALAALERLASRLPTIVYSQASHGEYQLGRIREAGVTEILGEERIVIVDLKTPEAFRNTLARFGIGNPAKTVMVGNSFRSDINPALLAGARALLVEPYEMWHYDNVPPVSDAFVSFRTFPDAVEYLLDPGGNREEAPRGRCDPGKGR
jgi:putative hydrolase of the HAD superfamily